MSKDLVIQTISILNKVGNQYNWTIKLGQSISVFALVSNVVGKN